MELRFRIRATPPYYINMTSIDYAPMRRMISFKQLSNTWYYKSIKKQPEL